MPEQPEREPVQRFQQPLVERETLAVQRDQAQRGTLVLAAGMDHEPVVEGGILAGGAAEGGPELLLAESNRVIRYHKLSGWVARGGPGHLLHVTCQAGGAGGQRGRGAVSS